MDETIEKVTSDGVTVKVTADSIEIPQPTKVLDKKTIVSRLADANQRRETIQRDIDVLEDLLSLID